MSYPSVFLLLFSLQSWNSLYTFSHLIFKSICFIIKFCCSPALLSIYQYNILVSLYMLFSWLFLQIQWSSVQKRGKEISWCSRFRGGVCSRYYGGLVPKNSNLGSRTCRRGCFHILHSKNLPEKKNYKLDYIPLSLHFPTSEFSTPLMAKVFSTYMLPVSKNYSWTLYCCSASTGNWSSSLPYSLLCPSNTDRTYHTWRQRLDTWTPG